MRKLLVALPEICRTHIPGPGWPEQPDRLSAIRSAISSPGVTDLLDVRRQVDPVTMTDLTRVHTDDYIHAVEDLCSRGGGPLDPDTYVSSGSFEAATAAAGAGPDMVRQLREGGHSGGFVAARPPGHHALPYMGMGFCVFNNVAITAAHLSSGGERVAIIDWDVHHGNGTQDIFWNDPSVLYASIHQSPMYPGSGVLTDTGGPAAEGLNINIPLPAGSAGDAYTAAMNDVLTPLVKRFGPDWVLVSAGFDAHRADRISGMLLESGDYGSIMRASANLSPAPDRVIAFLEGGYELASLEASVRSSLAALLGLDITDEPRSEGSTGLAAVERARHIWSLPPNRTYGRCSADKP